VKIVAIILAGLFLVIVIASSISDKRQQEEEAKIPWADMSFFTLGGEVMATNKEPYDLRNCTITQYTGSADYWSIDHINIPAKKSSDVLEPSQFSNGAEDLDPSKHKTKMITVRCDSEKGKRRSGAVLK
jgi:hypothetical protein